MTEVFNSVLALKPFKTGSTTLGRGILEKIPSKDGNGFLMKFRNGHLLPETICEKWGYDIFYDSFRCITVRNPYDRLVSAYEFIKKNRASNEKQWFNTFDEFVDNLYQLEHYLPMSKYCFLYGKNIIEYVIRFESLEQDIKNMLARIGYEWNKPFPHMQKTKHKPYKEYYNKSLQDKVYDIYKKDFEMFKYNKEIV